MNRALLRALVQVLSGALLVLILDQWSKWLVLANTHLLPVTVIPGCFRVVYVENPGVAFGMLAGMGPLLLVPSVAGCALVLYLLYHEVHTGQQTPLLVPALAMILGGALGNMIDRLRFGHVVDFIDWYWNNYHWYTFNVADAGISVGVVLLIAGPFLFRRTRRREQSDPSCQ